MIKLKFNCEFTESSSPFAGKLSKCNRGELETLILNDNEVKCFYDEIKRGYIGRSTKGNVFIPCDSALIYSCLSGKPLINASLNNSKSLSEYP